MARRAIWSGSISFGLVSIPIRMYNATLDRDIHFHLLHDQDKARLQRKLVSSTSGKEVHPEHIIRGFEVAKDQYVVVQQDEIQSCEPEKSRAIEITDFVDLHDIDPLYYDRPYYLAPEPVAAKPYHLLVEAMEKAKKVALASFIMHEKGHLAALRPVGKVICLETMRFSDEIVPAREVEPEEPKVKLAERELKAALQLIDSLSGPFDPTKYTDKYRECIESIVQKKARGEEIHVEAPSPRRVGHAADLMSALEASLAATRKQQKPANGNGHPRRRKNA